MSKKGGNGQTPYSYRTRYPENGGRERGLRRFLPMWLRRLLRLGRLPPRRPGLDAFGRTGPDSRLPFTWFEVCSRCKCDRDTLAADRDCPGESQYPNGWFCPRCGKDNPDEESPLRGPRDVSGLRLPEASLMAVYVDDMRAGFGRMVMCHMMADTDAELHAMADRIGVQRKWFQAPPRHDPHYDIAQSKRALAVQAGAVQVTLRVLAYMNRRRKETGSLGKPEDAEAWFKSWAESRRIPAGGLKPCAARSP